MKLAGIDIVTSVPCVNLQELIRAVQADSSIVHIPVTREEEGVGICAGAYMGGKNPAILMQNSGLGNSINALASLNSLYGIPLLMIISHRGVAGELIEAQVPMGRLTVPLLEAMGIAYLTPSVFTASKSIVEAWQISMSRRMPVAVLLDLGFWRRI